MPRAKKTYDPNVINKTAVVALGGNAITLPNVEDTITNQFEHTRRALRGVLGLVKDDYKLIITHGNGPQVGNALLRVEAAAKVAPILPLGICVADTEGGMGYMIEQCLQNVMHEAKLARPVATIVTQMMIDRHDPAIENPTKFVGKYYTEKEAKNFKKSRRWIMKQDGSNGWRRVVPSPTPVQLVGARVIKRLVRAGVIVVAAGGGGVPVYMDERGWLEGIDAVIDKDLASAVVARNIGADTLLILTGVDRVAINFGKPDQKFLKSMTASTARKHLDEGQFPAGSMGPKIKAALKFLDQGGKQVIVTSFELASKAMSGKAGTRITP